MPDIRSPKPHGGGKRSSGKNAESRRLYWTLAIGGLAIAGSGLLLSHSLHKLNATQFGASGSDPVPLVRRQKPPNPALLTYRTHIGSASSFQEIQSADRYYQNAAARWVAYRFRLVQVRGPDAGKISLQALRLASGIVPLPKTLAAAGVKVTPSTPADGSIQGISGAAVGRLTDQAKIRGTPITPSEAKALLQSTASAGLAFESNNPLTLLNYVDGLAPKRPFGLFGQSVVDPRGALMTHIVGANAGILPNAVHFYRRWALVASNPRAQWLKPTPMAGQTVEAEVRLTDPVSVDAISTAEHGGVIADTTMTPFQSVTLVLIQSQGKNLWFVTGYQLHDANLHVTKVLAHALDGQVQ